MTEGRCQNRQTIETGKRFKILDFKKMMKHEQITNNFQNISNSSQKTFNILEFCWTETQEGHKNLCRSDKAITSISTSTCEQHSHWSFWTEPIDWLSRRNGGLALPKRQRTCQGCCCGVGYPPRREITRSNEEIMVQLVVPKHFVSIIV